MNWKLCLFLSSLILTACSSSLVTTTSAREPQQQTSVDWHPFSETPEERKVREFLMPLAGIYQFTGSKGCDSIVIQTYREASAQYVEAQFGSRKTWAGGVTLIPVENKIEDRCEFVSAVELHCFSKRKLPNEISYKRPEITVEYRIVKDASGQLQTIDLAKSRTPTMSLSCQRPQ